MQPIPYCPRISDTSLSNLVLKGEFSMLWMDLSKPFPRSYTAIPARRVPRWEW